MRTPARPGLAGATLLAAFEGLEAPPWVADMVAHGDVPGFTLFASNMAGTDQVVDLTRMLQQGAGSPRLIAADQEGGQLLGFGAGTPFAGNMALGAAGDPELARAVAAAMGRELRAVGVNVDYAPVCDVASRAGNPSLGIRSFGQDPAKVAALAAAMVDGLQSVGVAAVLKHFPGKGEAAVDPHYSLPVLDLDRDRFDRVEFPPFRAGIAAGARVTMIGHYACPRLTGRHDLPASLSSTMVDEILRRNLGFEGVVITDALDMGAIQQPDGVDPAAALEAGVDLLLCAQRREDQERLRSRLDRAEESGRLPAARVRAGIARVERLRAWLATFPNPDLSVIRSPGHLELAQTLAERAITLVRDDGGLLPLPPSGRLLAVMPEPTDLTPADTSSRVEPGLAAALRRRHPAVTGMVVGHDPTGEQITSVVEAAADHDLAVIGTVSATRAQAALVAELIASGIATVTVAMRTPDDLCHYPRAGTHLCSYGILPPSMEALAAALFGAPISGRLPVSIPAMYRVGHGLIRR